MSNTSFPIERVLT